MPGAFATAPGLPEELQVEVTGACNLRCRMCLVRYARPVGRREGALSYESYLELVDALPRLRKLTLQGLGEPLLSPHLVDMVAHARSRDVAVGFNTNGTLLDRPIAERLIDAGLSWLHVSLDGATAATYEDVRHGTALRPRPGQFEQVVRNLRGLVAARDERGGEYPRILLVFVAMRRNVGELEALVELGADIGVDEIWVQNLSHTFSDTDAAGAYREMREYAHEEALFGDANQTTGDAERATTGPEPSTPGLEPSTAGIFSRARETAARLGMELRLPDLSERAGQRMPGEPGCTWPWDSAYVTHRGEVQPCCMVMGSDRATLGRLSERPFADVWRGRSYRNFRARLLDGEPPEVCRGCSLYRGLF